MKTRFAPSPTGYLTIGNIRTALFCTLLAKHEKGTFLLRIEDTDKLRSGHEFTEQLQYDMHWLGLDWQEGPEVGGKNAPYFQSERQNIYDKYFQQLETQKQVYPCFCSDEELAVSRKIQLSSGQPPRYEGTCRNLTAEQINKKLAEGLKPTLRFRVPENQVIEFTDFVRGPQKFVSHEIGDFIIRRGDGSAAFFFCNAIDDSLMEITHVLRGEDHLTNTPRQLMLLQALRLSQPQYGHLALIVGPDGSPLSKRHGSRSIKVLHKQGFLAAAIVNYLARVGHYYANNNFMSLNELAQEFFTKNLNTSPAHYDESQLLYWQKQAVAHLSQEEFVKWLGEELSQKIPTTHQNLFVSAIQNSVSFPEEVDAWIPVFFESNLALTPEISAEVEQVHPEFYTTAVQAVEQYGIDFKKVATHIQEKLNVKGKGLYQPLRLALTGRHDGPEMVKIFELLGEENLKIRLKKFSK